MKCYNDPLPRREITQPDLTTSLFSAAIRHLKKREGETLKSRFDSEGQEGAAYSRASW